MRLLVLRGGALGDFIVTLPALRALRRHWPAAVIELAGNPTAAALGVMTGDLDVVHSQHEARWSQLYREEPLTLDFRQWLDAFDYVISFWPDPDGELRRHFAHRETTFIASHATVTSRPAAAHFCQALVALGVSANEYAVGLTFSEAIKAEASQRLSGLDGFIAVHPGSGSPKKNWPWARWKELLSDLDRPLLLVSGEAERIPDDLPRGSRVLHAQAWPLPVLARALAQSVAFLGHDSGVSHLAAAAGAPGLLLFGPTDPAIWAPPYPQVETLHGNETLDTITVSAVRLRLAELLSQVAPRQR